jgi:hypothetical protein
VRLPSLLTWLSILFWLTLVLTLVMALLPASPVNLLAVGDKVLHIFAFSVLSLFASLAFPHRRVIELFAGLAVLGATIEAMQMIPALRRDAEFSDWLADCAAISTMLLLYRGLRWRLTDRSASDDE